MSINFIIDQIKKYIYNNAPINFDLINEQALLIGNQTLKRDQNLIFALLESLPLDIIGPNDFNRFLVFLELIEFKFDNMLYDKFSALILENLDFNNVTSIINFIKIIRRSSNYLEENNLIEKFIVKLNDILEYQKKNYMNIEIINHCVKAIKDFGGNFVLDDTDSEKLLLISLKYDDDSNQEQKFQKYLELLKNAKKENQFLIQEILLELNKYLGNMEFDELYLIDKCLDIHFNLKCKSESLFLLQCININLAISKLKFYHCFHYQDKLLFFVKNALFRNDYNETIINMLIQQIDDFDNDSLTELLNELSQLIKLFKKGNLSEPKEINDYLNFGKRNIHHLYILIFSSSINMNYYCSDILIQLLSQHFIILFKSGKYSEQIVLNNIPCGFQNDRDYFLDLFSDSFISISTQKYSYVTIKEYFKCFFDCLNFLNYSVIEEVFKKCFEYFFDHEWIYSSDFFISGIINNDKLRNIYFNAQIIILTKRFKLIKNQSKEISLFNKFLKSLLQLKQKNFKNLSNINENDLKSFMKFFKLYILSHKVNELIINMLLNLFDILKYLSIDNKLFDFIFSKKNMKILVLYVINTNQNSKYFSNFIFHWISNCNILFDNEYWIISFLIDSFSYDKNNSVSNLLKLNIKEFIPVKELLESLKIENVDKTLILKYVNSIPKEKLMYSTHVDFTINDFKIFFPFENNSSIVLNPFEAFTEIKKIINFKQKDSIYKYLSNYSIQSTTPDYSKIYSFLNVIVSELLLSHKHKFEIIKLIHKIIKFEVKKNEFIQLYQKCSHSKLFLSFLILSLCQISENNFHISINNKDDFIKIIQNISFILTKLYTNPYLLSCKIVNYFFQKIDVDFIDFKELLIFIDNFIISNLKLKICFNRHYKQFLNFIELEFLPSKIYKFIIFIKENHHFLKIEELFDLFKHSSSDLSTIIYCEIMSSFINQPEIDSMIENYLTQEKDINKKISYLLRVFPNHFKYIEDKVITFYDNFDTKEINNLKTVIQLCSFDYSHNRVQKYLECIFYNFKNIEPSEYLQFSNYFQFVSREGNKESQVIILNIFNALCEKYKFYFGRFLLAKYRFRKSLSILFLFDPHKVTNYLIEQLSYLIDSNESESQVIFKNINEWMTFITSSYFLNYLIESDLFNQVFRKVIAIYSKYYYPINSKIDSFVNFSSEVSTNAFLDYFNEKEFRKFSLNFMNKFSCVNILNEKGNLLLDRFCLYPETLIFLIQMQKPYEDYLSKILKICDFKSFKFLIKFLLKNKNNSLLTISKNVIDTGSKLFISFFKKQLKKIDFDANSFIQEYKKDNVDKKYKYLYLFIKLYPPKFLSSNIIHQISDILNNSKEKLKFYYFVRKNEPLFVDFKRNIQKDNLYYSNIYNYGIGELHNCDFIFFESSFPSEYFLQYLQFKCCQYNFPMEMLLISYSNNIVLYNYILQYIALNRLTGYLNPFKLFPFAFYYFFKNEIFSEDKISNYLITFKYLCSFLPPSYQADQTILMFGKRLSKFASKILPLYTKKNELFSNTYSEFFGDLLFLIELLHEDNPFIPVYIDILLKSFQNQQTLLCLQLLESCPEMIRILGKSSYNKDFMNVLSQMLDINKFYWPNALNSILFISDEVSPKMNPILQFIKDYQIQPTKQLELIAIDFIQNSKLPFADIISNLAAEWILSNNDFDHVLDLIKEKDFDFSFIKWIVFRLFLNKSDNIYEIIKISQIQKLLIKNMPLEIIIPYIKDISLKIESIPDDELIFLDSDLLNSNILDNYSFNFFYDYTNSINISCLLSRKIHLKTIDFSLSKIKVLTNIKSIFITNDLPKWKSFQKDELEDLSFYNQLLSIYEKYNYNNLLSINNELKNIQTILENNLSQANLTEYFIVSSLIEKKIPLYLLTKFDIPNKHRKYLKMIDMQIGIDDNLIQQHKLAFKDSIKSHCEEERIRIIKPEIINQSTITEYLKYLLLTSSSVQLFDSCIPYFEPNDYFFLALHQQKFSDNVKPKLTLFNLYWSILFKDDIENNNLNYELTKFIHPSILNIDKIFTELTELQEMKLMKERNSYEVKLQNILISNQINQENTQIFDDIQPLFKIYNINLKVPLISNIDKNAIQVIFKISNTNSRSAKVYLLLESGEKIKYILTPSTKITPSIALLYYLLSKMFNETAICRKLKQTCKSIPIIKLKTNYYLMRTDMTDFIKNSKIEKLQDIISSKTDNIPKVKKFLNFSSSQQLIEWSSILSYRYSIYCSIQYGLNRDPPNPFNIYFNEKQIQIFIPEFNKTSNKSFTFRLFGKIGLYIPKIIGLSKLTEGIESIFKCFNFRFDELSLFFQIVKKEYEFEENLFQERISSEENNIKNLIEKSYTTIDRTNLYWV